MTHDNGPDIKNKDVQATLQAVDNFILNTLKSLEDRNASSIVNVVVVSDHGMTSTSNNQLLYLDDLLGPDLYSQLQHWDGWPNVGLSFANNTLLEAASKRLKGASYDVPYSIASRAELVKLWNWEMTDTVQERVADLWILPDVGWSVTTKEEMISFSQNYIPKG